MKVYFTLYEGGKWFEDVLSRKELNAALKDLLTTIKRKHGFTGSICINKAPYIYDFTLLRNNNQPWIRNRYHGSRRES